MRKAFIFALPLGLLVAACGPTSSAPESATTDGTTATKATTTPSISAKLDSIDQANEASVLASGDNITKAYVFLESGDSTLHLTANMRQDHRIWGYEKPDTRSARLLLLSIFTNDVENNPFACKLGAYYDTSGMGALSLKYLATSGNFVKAVATDPANQSTILYFEKKWIDIQ